MRLRELRTVSLPDPASSSRLWSCGEGFVVLFCSFNMSFSDTTV